MAASEGQVGVLELLLTRQANIEAADPDGLTPVAFAVIRGITILKKQSICSIHVMHFEISRDFCPFQAKFARSF